MHLYKIDLINFKNHPKSYFEFIEGVNCITGSNGVGKTNLLDAVYYLSMTKSAFTASDQQNIKMGSSFFAIHSQVNSSGKSYRLSCTYEENKGKNILIDKKLQNPKSEHIGRFPLALISPYDTDIIRGGSEIRRKFVDVYISQTNKNYLSDIISYNRLLKQRNALLKKMFEENKKDFSLVDVYNQQLLPLNIRISNVRKAYLAKFIPWFSDIYQKLTNNLEKVNINYESHTNDSDFEQQFLDSFKTDLQAQRTTLGIHKDDLEFLMNDVPVKKYGSQGQQKSYVLSLKIAQHFNLREDTGIRPFLLLDDIFDKLDEARITNLIKLIGTKEVGQIFITDARPERSAAILYEAGIDYKEIRL